MKKRDVLSLIKFHCDGNDVGFRQQATDIAREFDELGESELSNYIMSLLYKGDLFVPQMYEDEKSYFSNVDNKNRESIFLPDKLVDEISGIINAINRGIGINKFLFSGMPGTGKTECALQIAKILNRESIMMNFNNIIDSKLGQTQKNLEDAFGELNSIKCPEKYLIILDELDSIVLNRTNLNDVREMGRATSTFLKMLDKLNSKIMIIATTNLMNQFDRAVIRRFDYVVNFDVYTKNDLSLIANELLNGFIGNNTAYGRDSRLVSKIIDKSNCNFSPAELKNIIRTSLAFSKPDDKFDYIRRIYVKLIPEANFDINKLQKDGYTVREIEHLTGTSKSQVSRLLKDGDDNE